MSLRPSKGPRLDYLEDSMVLNLNRMRRRRDETFALIDAVKAQGLWREGGHASFDDWLSSLQNQDAAEAYREAQQ